MVKKIQQLHRTTSMFSPKERHHAISLLSNPLFPPDPNNVYIDPYKKLSTSVLVLVVRYKNVSRHKTKKAYHLYFRRFGLIYSHALLNTVPSKSSLETILFV